MEDARPGRRRFLAQAGASVVGGAWLTGCERVVDPILNPAEDLDTSGWIDAHAHIWTSDLERYPLGQGFGVDRLRRPSFTVEELMAECRPHGVTRVVLIQNTFYREDHSYLLDTMRAFPGSFGGVAIVDPTKTDEPVPQMKALARQGIRGFRVRARAEAVPTWLESPAMRAVWQTAAEEGLFVCLLANEDALPDLYRVCETYPETPVVIDHCGRIGVSGTIERTYLDALLRLAEFETVNVKISAFYALGKKEAPYTDLAPMIRELRDAYGAERLMWATDCPFQVMKGYTYGDSIALVRDRLDFLSDSERDWMLRGTAERVFFT